MKHLITLSIFILALIMGGCGSSGGGSSSDDSATPPPPPEEFCFAPASPPQGTFDLSLVRAFPNLSFNEPVKALLEPGTNDNWFVVERGGNLQRFANNESTANSETYLNLAVSTGGEQGFLSIAFAPDWPNTKEIYASYTMNGSGGGRESRISRLVIQNDSTLPATFTEELILIVNQPRDIHNGGDIAFGPDGYLYFGLGDGGESNDALDNAQNTTNMLGSMIRIDVDGVSYPTPSYNIPSGNIFSGNTRCGPGVNNNSCPEIFAWGLRNPWRWSFDEVTGLLWLADVGQDAFEEVNIINSGENYGWPCYEASQRTSNSSTHINCNTASFTAPVHEYAHSGFTSTTGGLAYRGNEFASLRGQYFFGDFGNGRVWSLAENSNGSYSATEQIDSTINISAFAEDEDGELLLLSYFNGQIYRLTGTSNGGNTSGGLPNSISNTGCLSATDIGTPTEDLFGYLPNARFWSDNAEKNRWIKIPNGTAITPDNGNTGTPTGNIWEFPNGTVTMKNFIVEDKLVETRFFIKHLNGEWGGYSYEWNEAATSATQVIDGKQRVLTHTTQPQTWIYPSQNQCLDCHTTAAGSVLGVNSPQLNHASSNPILSSDGNQLEDFASRNWFSPSITQPVTVLDTITDHSDASQPLDQRARSYLHTNCSSCHQPGAVTQTNIDLRYFISLNNTNICDTAPSQGDLGISNARIIAPGEPSRSVLLQRMDSTDENIRMPRVGSNVVDTNGVELISDWINSLSLGSCN